jgi:hypothetical protein
MESRNSYQNLCAISARESTKEVRVTLTYIRCCFWQDLKSFTVLLTEVKPQRSRLEPCVFAGKYVFSSLDSLRMHDVRFDSRTETFYKHGSKMRQVSASYL